MLGPRDWLMLSVNNEGRSIFDSIMDCLKCRPRRALPTLHSIPLSVIQEGKTVSSISGHVNVDKSSSKIETPVEDSVKEQKHKISVQEEENDEYVPPISSVKRQTRNSQCNRKVEAKPKKSKLISYYIVSVIYIILLIIIPFVPGIFDVSLVWKDQTCKEGYYNINWNTSDIKVLKCEGMILKI